MLSGHGCWARNSKVAGSSLAAVTKCCAHRQGTVPPLSVFPAEIDTGLVNLPRINVPSIQ